MVILLCFYSFYVALQITIRISHMPYIIMRTETLMKCTKYNCEYARHACNCKKHKWIIIQTKILNIAWCEGRTLAGHADNNNNSRYIKDNWSSSLSELSSSTKQVIPDERISKPKIRLWCTYIIQDHSKPNISKK